MTGKYSTNISSSNISNGNNSCNFSVIIPALSLFHLILTLENTEEKRQKKRAYKKNHIKIIKPYSTNLSNSDKKIKQLLIIIDKNKEKNIANNNSNNTNNNRVKKIITIIIIAVVIVILILIAIIIIIIIYNNNNNNL